MGLKEMVLSARGPPRQERTLVNLPSFELEHKGIHPRRNSESELVPHRPAAALVMKQLPPNSRSPFCALLCDARAQTLETTFLDPYASWLPVVLCQ